MVVKIDTFVETVNDKGTAGNKLRDLRQESQVCCSGRNRISILFPGILSTLKSTLMFGYNLCNPGSYSQEWVIPTFRLRCKEEVRYRRVKSG